MRSEWWMSQEDGIQNSKKQQFQYKDERPRDEVIHLHHDTRSWSPRVISYWSRTLKLADGNYSPTEREASASRDGLLKFQPYIEGETVIAITDHVALIWSHTFQNVNRRLLTWGTVFAAYLDLKIVHSTGRVHFNVDPISRLRRNTPYQDGTHSDNSIPTIMDSEQDCLVELYLEISPQLKARTLHLMA